MSLDGPAQNPVSPPGGTPDAVKVLAKRLEDLFQSMRDELVSTLSLILGSRDDAMDVAQEAFLRCWKHREQLLGVANPRAWIFRVGINAAKDLRRSAWRRKSRPMLPEEAMPAVDRKGIPETLEAGEEWARVRLAVEELRDEEKEIFLMRQNGELTLEEIAQVVGRPVGTVKTQLRAALGKLRVALGVPNGENEGRE